MSSSDDFIHEDEYADLSPDEKVQFITIRVSKFINKHPEGLARSEILEKVPFSRKTLDKHIIRLTALNEIRIERRGKADVVYPKGRPIETDKGVFEVELEESTLQIQAVEQSFGEIYYHIATVNETEFGDIPTGGLLLPAEDVEPFLSSQEEVGEKILQALREWYCR